MKPALKLDTTVLESACRDLGLTLVSAATGAYGGFPSLTVVVSKDGEQLPIHYVDQAWLLDRQLARHMLEGNAHRLLHPEHWGHRAPGYKGDEPNVES